MLRSTLRNETTARQEPLLDLTERDQDLITAVARYRILSYQQVGARIFAGRAPTIVGRRLRKLRDRGWLEIWEDWVPRGGHPRYVFLTKQALEWAFPRLRQEAGTFGPLVELMARSESRRPLRLESRKTPAFLAHQREVATMGLAFELGEQAPFWFSAWDRPFPNARSGLKLPQPDWVAVFGDRLVFGEHDRGQESLSHWMAAKVERYSILAADPALLQELTGFRTFTVAVSVLDVRSRRPIARARRLANSVLERGDPGLFRFALAGRAAADPYGPIWWDPWDLVADDERDAQLSDGQARALLASSSRIGLGDVTLGSSQG